MGEVMTYSLFQKLTESELNNYLGEIDKVLEFHIKWLSEVNRLLIFPLKNTKNNLLIHEDFKRWYSSVNYEGMLESDALTRLNTTYDAMMNISKTLLESVNSGSSVSDTDYDAFLQFTKDFRKQLNTLKRKIRSDLKLMAILMGKIFENAEEGVMITDVKSQILNVNNAFEKVTQYRREDVFGLTPAFLHSGSHDKGFYERMWAVILREGRWQGEIWNRRKNNDIYPEWLSIMAVYDEDGKVTHYIGIFSDVSTENEGNERLYHLAHYDSLCDLPNRMLFYDRLRQAISRSKRSEQRIAVMFMDLDGFKKINDKFGHCVGDELLQQVSKRIVGMLRETDTIARVGGDEFTFIINDIDSLTSINTIATKVLATIKEPYSLHGNTFNISASIGVSLLADNSDDIGLIVKQADIAMYKAKKLGGNKFVFYEESLE